MTIAGKGAFKIDYGSGTTSSVAAGASVSHDNISFSVTFSSAPLVFVQSTGSCSEYATCSVQSVTTSKFKLVMYIDVACGGGTLTYGYNWFAIGS